MKDSLPLENSQSRANPSGRDNDKLLWLGGIAFTGLIALLGYGIAQLPWLDHLGPLALAILLSVLYRQIWGYPEKLRSGIQFSSKKLLRLAIVLYGLKLNIAVILHQGMGLLVRDLGTIVFSIVLMMLLAKWLKADRSISLLLGVGTGICGAAAIAAISPIIRSQEEDTAISVGIIAFIGTIFSVGYTLLMPWLPITANQYGIWTGVSLHEIAHVALAGAPAGQDALALALLAKLGRVLLLIPVSFLFMYWIKRTDKGKQQTGAKPEFPWFLIGFILMSVLGSWMQSSSIAVSTSLLNTISSATVFILSMAMVGLGLNVSFKDLRTKALRPVIAVTITSVLLSTLTYFTL
ncbi:YeiH family protein [Brevibacillus ginsengisoli]|uniref:YeiH family protein n=1 Tax=Brevibacillus ginsengisoli TaxID=363854 RepID=UPI003CEAE2A6